MEIQQNIDVYQIITNKIIAQLEEQVIPWRKPWTEAGHPQNLVTKRNYTGINTWMLAALGYSQNYFLTWNQLKEAGASVRKGEKGHIVIFWKRVKPEQAEPEAEPQKPKSVLRYYYVFNIAQCDGLPEIVTVPYPTHDVSQITACEEIIGNMPQSPAIKHTKHKAYYDPAKDYINLPKQGTFSTAESYYSTLFHELMHSTGHASRLNRKGITEANSYGSDPYCMEELIAEIGACYLNSVAGIIDQEFDSSISYIDGWLKVLKSDKRFIIFASGHAQRAADFVLNVQYQPQDAGGELETAETQ